MTARWHSPRSGRYVNLDPVIRGFRPDDTDAFVAIWRSASSVAHTFLNETFMTQEAINLRAQHLPNAQNGPAALFGLLVAK